MILDHDYKPVIEPWNFVLVIYACQCRWDQTALRRRRRDQGEGVRVEKRWNNPTHSKLLFLPAEVGQSRARQADQRSYSASFSDSFRRIVAMAEGILVADWSTTSGGAAMHPTAAFAAYRWRLARVPAPGPRCAAAYPRRCLLVPHHAGSLDFFAADESTVPTMA